MSSNRFSAQLFSGLTCLVTSLAASAQEPSVSILPNRNTSTLSRSRGSSFNPDISANTLFLYTQSKEGNLATSLEPNGLLLQETEIQFTADVDPYSHLVALFSLHPEISSSEDEGRTTEYVFEPEEVFAETLRVPSITLKAGKFKTAFGKHNLLHTHAYPFIDAPLFQTALLSEEGMNDLGVSASALMPVPWFFEITAQAIRGEAEGLDYFNSRSANDVATLAHFKNLWDLNDSSTLEFGLSAATGENRFEDRTEFAGFDLTYKWRPVEGGKYNALIVAVEGLQRNVNEAGGAKNESMGLSTWVQWQFARRWWAQARAEWLDSKDKGDVANPTELPSRTNKWSALIGFVPSEFSSLRMQYDNIDQAGADEIDHRFLVQMNFSIGAHPAHAY